MLETFTVDTFQPRLDERFVLADEVDLTLAEVRELPTHDSLKRRPFAIVFNGPETPFVPQGSYKLEHPELGAFELFLVPIGPTSYEAVFT
jgi:hypothetical protein